MALGSAPLGSAPLGALDSSGGIAAIIGGINSNIKDAFGKGTATVSLTGSISSQILPIIGYLYGSTILTYIPSLRMYFPRSRTITYSPNSRDKVFFPGARNVSYTTSTRVGS